MINTVTVTNDRGESITLDLFDPWSSGFGIRSIDGLGPVNANINMTDYASIDGASHNGSKQSTRNITMDLVFFDSIKTIEQVRHDSYRYFPPKRNITIRIETDTRTLETDGYVEKNEPSIFGDDLEGCQVSVLCESPYFRSPNMSIAKLSSIVDSFKFPFASRLDPELVFGYLNTDQSVTMTNTGDVETGLEFELIIFDTIINPTIYNYSTNEWFGLDNISLQANDVVTITTDKGNKHVYLTRDNSKIDIINYIRKGLTWLNLEVGDNTFIMDYMALKEVTNLPAAVAEFECNTPETSQHNGLLYLTAEIKSESAVKTVTLNRSGEDTSNPTTQTFDWSETDIPGVTNGKIAWYRSGKVTIIDDNNTEHDLEGTTDIFSTLVGTNKVWCSAGDMLTLAYQPPIGTQATLNIKHYNKYLGI